METKAILWDLDGVIVDSAIYHYEAYRRIFEGLGRTLTGDEFFTGLIGLRNDAIVRKVLGEIQPKEAQRIADLKERTFRALAAGNIEALPGARHLIEDAGRAGIRQAIVSSTPRANIDLILSSLKLVDAFSVIVGEEDAAKGKPDPEGFLVAISRLEVEPGACVVIEDAPEGIAAGKAAGARTLAVTTTRPRESLGHADFIVPLLSDARAWKWIRGDTL